MIPMKYLNLVHRRDLFNWSVAYHWGIGHSYSDKYPLVALGVFLYRSRNIIDVKDDIVYKRVSISTIGKGVSVRDERQGKKIGTKKQYRINSGQFLVSKIDARNGAFGVVPLEAENAIITGNFWAYDVDYNLIDPHYLALITRTQEFTSFCEKASNGTTNRHYLQESLFLSQKIPLPSLEEQNKIIATYNATIAQAKQYSTQAKDIDKQIEKYLQEILGLGIQLKTKSKTSYSFLRLYKFSETRNRWDLNKVRNSYKGNYEFVCLSDVASKMSTGTTPPTRNKEYFNGDIDFYTPADIGRNMYLGDAERYISQIAIRDNKARCFYKGDLLFVGIGSTVGKVGLVNKEMVSSNQQITGITFNTQKILPEYAFIYMHYFKENTTANQSKTTLPIVNQEKIAKIPLPLPPLTIQNKIVEHITALRSTQKNLQQKSLTLRQQATEQFEQIIFE